MHELPINTDTINKSIDIIDETTKETRKELDKRSAKGVHKLSQLFWASPLGIKADVYIQERPYKLKKALEEMQVKYDFSLFFMLFSKLFSKKSLFSMILCIMLFIIEKHLLCMTLFSSKTSYQIGASLVYFFLLFFPHIIYAN